MIEQQTHDGSPEPLNYQGPLPGEVVALVSKFLETPIESDGGWADIPDEEWKMLYEVFYQIIEAKFQRDCDHDQTVEFELCNRKRSTMEVLRIPYDMETDADFEQAMHVIGHAASVIERQQRRISFMLSDRRRADARRKKMAPVIGFLASNGHIPAHNRVKEFVWTGGNLFIGRDDTVWSPLGLTCEDLQTVYKAHLGRANLYDMIDDALLEATNKVEGN